MNIVDDLLFKEETYQVIGICMKIHSRLGRGFKEIVYKDALEVELIRKQISYEREKSFKIEYEGAILKHRFDADFLIFDCIILEIKAAWKIHTDNFKQTLNYLKASQIKLGILINFGEQRLNFKRVVCTY
jgi:GxxExxY protein